MNQKRTISLFVLLVIIINMFLPTLSLALETGTAEASILPSKTNVTRGEEITVSIRLNTNGAEDITLSQIYMYFDTNVLEPVGEPTLDSQFEEAVPSNTIRQPSIVDNCLNFLWTSGTTSDDFSLNYNGTVCKVTFKVKENATIGTSNLTIESDSNVAPVVGGLDSLGGMIKIPYEIVNSNISVILPVNTIALDKTQLDLTVPDTGTLNVIYNPTNTTEKEITWTTDDDSVATVESTTDGVATVKSVGSGTATITATSKNGATAKCTVNVIKLIPIESVELNKTELVLDRGKSEKLTATVLPTDTTDAKTITWSSENEGIAKVEQDGTVTAVEKGSTKIIATSTNGKTAECVVTVGVPLESISFAENITSKTMNKGEDFTLTVVYNPEDTDTDKTITWRSSNTAVADVDTNGKVKAIDDGEAEITATSVNGRTATCKIEVVIPLKSISIKESTAIKCGETEKLEVTFDPVDTTDDTTITWTSSDNDIATVSTNGTVTAKKIGNVTIKAETANGLYDECKVEVLPVPLDSIQIKEQNIILEKGKTQNLTVLFNPENTTDSKEITWESLNPEFVTVDNGEITAIANGTATIKATVNGKEATTTVTVVTPLKSISISEEKVTLNRPQTIDLDVTYNPDDTTDDRTVTWTSSNTDVATVDENTGLVTPIAPGTAYIKAKVGDKEDTCEVTVKVPLEGITIKSETELLKGKYEELAVTYDPIDATYEGKVTWTSSNTEVATVDENGKVTALKEGETIIKVTAIENDVEFTDECTVTVKEIKMDSILIDASDFDLGLGREKQLNILFYPEDTTDDRTITWTSSDEEIATVDKNGVVKALKIGEVTITATTVDGKTDTVEITVKEIPIEAITITAPTTVKVGESFSVQIAINPSDATNQDGIKYISSNSNVIQIDENGNAIAKSAGTAIITVEAENGVKNQIEITVENEEIGGENTTNSPKTGDIAVELLVGLMIISVLGITMILVKNKRK